MKVPARTWPRALERLSPALATVGLMAFGMASSTWWGPALAGKTAWAIPEDLWGTLVAAQRLIHLNLAGLYTQPTSMVTFPGAAVILAPVVALADLIGLPLRLPGAQNPQPVMWLVAGPYEILVSAVALFAADAVAVRLGATRLRRGLLTGAGAVALWSVSAEWGHPEDPVAVGLFLFGVLALSDARPLRSAWLIGAAIAVQPLVLLALPVVAVVIERRRLPGYAAVAAAPAGLLLAAAAWANWHATVRAVTSQPNSPAINHPTPWTSLAPHLSDGTIAAGPTRALTILGACACAVVVGRRWRASVRSGPRSAPWDATMLAELLWWIAVTLALRSAFEPVMVAYYTWPAIQVALIVATGSWARLVATSATTTVLTFASQFSWRGPWTWWTPMIAGLCLTLAFARVHARSEEPARGGEPSPEQPQQQPPTQPLVAEQSGQTPEVDQRQVSEVP